MTEQRQEGRCKAVFLIGDDFGDNASTHHCQLKKGHIGQHEETWNGNPYGKKPMPVTLRWGRDIRSRPAPLTQNDGGNCMVICQHCGKVTQVQCKKDGD